MKLKTFSYAQLDTFIHRLSGVTKLICFLLMTSAVMFTYDIRVIIGIMVFSYILMRIARIRFSQVRLMFVYVFIFLIANFILTFLFNPRYGTEIYGTEHDLFTFGGRYILTQEQLFYQITKFSKYLSVIPLGIIFVLTTNPSEFASSLNGIGISYKVGMSLSLTLRYFPDVADDFQAIRLAQEARGLDMSKKASVSSRLKNTSAILAPLLFTTMDRVDLISNAMDLRGFGKSKTRTWYARRPLGKADYVSIAVCALVLAISLYIRFAVNHSFYYNPFI
ncbi:MAG: energy-coupling factor transporter transmembrane component T [Lachnospiraceae bacterium]|uniref:energy-coupling factor transporter transmembrane component T family protein n=1 Tax=Galactobacillus timonensis TaxID=2041840 RepID=UPI0023F149D3|nr:energy-coupling factor transporter transmembrane component T [Galactobacillus timonensis]MCI6754527.1 energy-coupling factor transporter transmembrane protein EcfT [Galactobacillus timonensis]MDD7086763.1 energy-coupling factor transporter transmembrane component T [Galactobacillus timonensis]MDY5223344.1 energy-coupling factor transporter transmembrane component T [Lachnospiraceae bacterium]